MKRILACLLAITGPVFGHDPGISNVNVDLSVSPVTVRLTYALSDLMAAGVNGSDEAGLNDAASRAVEWRTASGPALLHVQSARAVDNTTAEFVLDVPRVPGTFCSLLLPEMPSGHRQLIVLRDHAGESYRIQMLSARNATEEISTNDLERTAPPLQLKVPQPSTTWPMTPWIALGVIGAMVIYGCVLRRGHLRPLQLMQ